jgi:hypothetical protein
MPSLPPIETYFILQVHLYWLVTTLVAWTVLAGLVGYLVGYRRPKYIVLRDSELMPRRGFADLPCLEDRVSEHSAGLS